MSNFNIRGIDELNNNLARLRQQTEEEVKKELTDIALDFASKSSESAPVKFGDLRGELAVPRKIPNGYVVGSSLPYTRKQHEHLEYHHPLGGGPKFLERPFNENKDGYIKAIKEVIKSVNK